MLKLKDLPDVLAKAELQPEDVVLVAVVERSRTYQWQPLGWIVRLQCSRQVWPCAFVRGGRSAVYELSRHSRQDKAEESANKFRRALNRLRHPLGRGP